MLDFEIVKFYNSVRDSAWPNIQSYAEYKLLPDFIKDECNQQHQFQTRKQQICSADYWINSTTDVCVYKNLAYVPIPKCAYFYHTTLFTNLGWKKVSLNSVDMDNTMFFGLVMHPLQRRLKGITQWIAECYRTNHPDPSLDNPWVVNTLEVDWEQLHSDLKTKYFNKILSTVNVGDVHSLPYDTMFGEFLDKVNWIPMDILSDDDVKISMMHFFKLHGHNIQLPLNDTRLHVSADNQKQLFDIIKHLFNSNTDNLQFFYKLYANDLKFYYNLIDNFTPDWQHI